MKAKIKPLEGKYYGTVVQITSDVDEYEMKLWMPEGRPSKRQLEYYKWTEKQWDNNELIEYGREMVPIKNEYPHNQHYESKVAYDVATVICNAINNADIKVQ